MEISEIYKLFLKSTGISTDTRNIKPNSIFFALKGDNFNGNKFADNAIANGALFAIIDETEYHNNEATILVENSLKTLQKLANYHRNQLKLPIIGLTGSNGKTTTKELINTVLSKNFKTTATVGNLNNHIGVPLTLLSMNADTEIGIVEMGANHQNEISALCNISEPDFGYITNFGKAHLEGFGGFEGVIKGKSELYQFLRDNSKIAFINKKDPLQLNNSNGIETVNLSSETELINATPFITLKYKNSVVNTKLIGTYNFINIQAAITIGEYFKVRESDIIQAIENYIPDNNRSQIIEKKNNKIILDAYNANPSSMNVALTNFSNITAKHKTIVLGDMFELGITSLEEHQNIVKLAESLDFDTILLVGKNFSQTKTSKSIQYESFEVLKSFYKPTLNSTVLIKGSRGMALERILDLFN
jgi:UDP-N-acetylmuramoyl-tripeptide--D-alanyl-D-alanine ligase